MSIVTCLAVILGVRELYFVEFGLAWSIDTKPPLKMASITFGCLMAVALASNNLPNPFNVGPRIIRFNEFL